jgi:hypothetical protein
MEIILDLIFITFFAPASMTKTGKWVLSRVGLQAPEIIQTTVGYFVWVAGIMLLTVVLILAIAFWK